MTTLQPRPPYSDQELQRLYPAGLELQLVQVLMRHGERTPVSARFQNAGLKPFWPYCQAARQFRAAVLDPDRGSFSTLQWNRRLETFGPDDQPLVAAGPRGELDAICDMGMLTDQGRATTHALGRRLRHLYVDQLGFLPPALTGSTADAGLYLRATPVPRALESMQQTLAAMYPPTTRLPAPDGSAFRPPTILVRALSDETLFPNDGNCRRFAALSRAFAQRTADRWNHSDDMQYLNRLWSRWMPEDSPRVAVDSRPRLSGIMDTINATLGHGPETRLPSEFYDPRARAIIERIGVEEWYSGYKESREYRALGIGSLMGDIVGRMVGSAEGSAADGEYELLKKKKNTNINSSNNNNKSKDAQTTAAAPVRFGLSGCHDTTLAGLLASLGAFDTDKWPPFTSHVAIEMFRTSDHRQPLRTTADRGWWSALKNSVTPGRAPAGIGRKTMDELTKDERDKLRGYYVRVRYNDEPVTIPGCKKTGNHLEGDESFCTLEAFKSIVDKYTPRNWKDECRRSTSDPVFPSEPEPAGY